MSDLAFVIRGATLLDGSGGEESVADVWVNRGRIAAIGDCPTEGVEVIDGKGLYLAPGFIDCHCHDDLAMLREPDRLEKVAQGVTTVIVGNCGFSLFPSTSQSRDDLRTHAGGLLGSLTTHEVFDDFANYSADLLRRGIGINVAALVGHGPLRLEVLGFGSQAVSSDERSKMCERLAKQFQMGAAGLSLGLVYPPSAFADRDELVALCKVAKEYGKPVAAHIRSYEAGLLEATHEFLDLLRASGARGVLSHLQAAGRPNWGSVVKALEVLDSANSEGIDVCFDMYPYLAGSSYVLQLLPPSVCAGGINALKAKFQDPEERANLKSMLARHGVDHEGWQSKVSVIGWESILIAGTEKDSLKAFEGTTFADAAQNAGCDPFDILEKLILEENGSTAIILFQLDEQDLKAAFSHPRHMVGSDGIPRCEGRPHPRTFGAFPRVLNTMARNEGWFSLAEAVRKMTSEPAKRFGLKDRGLLVPGAIADLVLFEPSFRDEATYEKPRLLAEGARNVWVNGIAVLADGHHTGLRPGMILSD